MLVLSLAGPLIAQDPGTQAGAQEEAGQRAFADLPSLQVTPAASTDGLTVLSWQLPGPLDSGLLQQSATPDFTAALSIPVSPVGRLARSGLADGMHYFRVGSDERWSPVRTVQVRHHALSQALLWFALGLLLFTVLVGVIVHGNVTSSRRQGGPHG